PAFIPPRDWEDTRSRAKIPTAFPLSALRGWTLLNSAARFRISRKNGLLKPFTDYQPKPSGNMRAEPDHKAPMGSPQKNWIVMRGIMVIRATGCTRLASFCRTHGGFTICTA